MRVADVEGNPDHPLTRCVSCAKNSSGIMKQYLPARPSNPPKRKPGSERGDGRLDENERDEAFARADARRKGDGALQRACSAARTLGVPVDVSPPAARSAAP